MGLASGETALPHILRIGQLSKKELQDCGIHTELLGNQRFAKLSSDEPEVFLQDEQLEKIFRMQMHTRKHRLQGLLLFMHAYPWRLILLSHPDAEARKGPD